jgi:hypothetical protein
LNFRKQTKAIAFADDLLIAVKTDSIREAENITNIEMNKILNWAKNNKINFNEQKSKAMVISQRKRKENKEITVYMNNKPLEHVQKIKCLGVIIDSKLNFREHVMHTVIKCTKLIHDLLMYSAPVWIEALEKECNKTVYNRVQCLINIKIAKAFRTTSTLSLYTLTGLTPIVIKAEEAAKLYSIIKKSQVKGIDYEVQPRD